MSAFLMENRALSLPPQPFTHPYLPSCHFHQSAVAASPSCILRPIVCWCWWPVVRRSGGRSGNGLKGQGR